MYASLHTTFFRLFVFFTIGFSIVSCSSEETPTSKPVEEPKTQSEKQEKDDEKEEVCKAVYGVVKFNYQRADLKLRKEALDSSRKFILTPYVLKSSIKRMAQNRHNYFTYKDTLHQSIEELMRYFEVVNDHSNMWHKIEICLPNVDAAKDLIHSMVKSIEELNVATRQKALKPKVEACELALKELKKNFRQYGKTEYENMYDDLRDRCMQLSLREISSLSDYEIVQKPLVK